MKILVTGGLGFIGFHLIKKLIDNNEIISIDFNLNISSDFVKKLREEELHKMNFLVSKIDIRNRDAVFSYFQNNVPDIVIHLAACTGIAASERNKELYFDVNVKGFVNILDACVQNKINHLIYASSSSVYNTSNEKFIEKDVQDNQLSYYGHTKRLNEHIANFYSNRYDIKLIGLRFFTVYGSFARTDMAAWKFMNAVTHGEPITLYDNGEIFRDFTHVSDITDSIAKIIEKKDKWLFSHQLFNIGHGSPISVFQYLNEISKNLNKVPIIISTPLPQNELKYTHASTDNLYDFINYKPAVSIKKGIKEMTDWFYKLEI